MSIQVRATAYSVLRLCRATRPVFAPVTVESRTIRSGVKRTRRPIDSLSSCSRSNRTATEPNSWIGTCIVVRPGRRGPGRGGGRGRRRGAGGGGGGRGARGRGGGGGGGRAVGHEN